MSGAARIKGALFVAFAMFLLSARCGAEALPATVMVGEVAGYGDYTLQVGFYETFRDVLEESLIVSQVHADLVRFESAENRYRRMCKISPQIALRAPLLFIASYLQMTPETLSRVRSTVLLD